MKQKNLSAHTRQDEKVQLTAASHRVFSLKLFLYVCICISANIKENPEKQLTLFRFAYTNEQTEGEEIIKIQKYINEPNYKTDVINTRGYLVY